MQKALNYDSHLVKIAELEYGSDDSQYAKTLLTKAQTLMAVQANEPAKIIDELNIAQEAEIRSLLKSGRETSQLLLRIKHMKGVVMLQLMGNMR